MKDQEVGDPNAGTIRKRGEDWQKKVNNRFI